MPRRHEPKLSKTHQLVLTACLPLLDMLVEMKGAARRSLKWSLLIFKSRTEKRKSSTWGTTGGVFIFLNWFHKGSDLWSRRTWKINNRIVLKKEDLGGGPWLRMPEQWAGEGYGRY